MSKDLKQLIKESYREALQEQKIPPEKLRLLREAKASAAADKTEFIQQCSLIIKELVENPEDVCGAFWQDGEQWYIGPQKATLKI